MESRPCPRPSPLSIGERKKYLPFVVVFLVALSARSVYLARKWPVLPDWNVDAMGYHWLATNLLERGVFSLSVQPPFQPDAIRTPLYPAFLALIYRLSGNAPRMVLVAQGVLDSLTAVLAMVVACKLAGPRRLYVVAGALYALYPVAWRYAAELYVETMLAFFVTLSFAVLLEALRAPGRESVGAAVALGVACAASLLVKPNVVFLPVVLGAALLARRGGWQAVVFAIVSVGLLLPWVVRNAVVFGHPMLSSVFQNNLARVSAPATLAEARGEVVVPWSARWEALFLEVVDAAAGEHSALFAIPMAEMTPRQLYEAQAALARAARKVVMAHPRAFVVSHFRGVLRGLRPQVHREWFARLSGQNWEVAMPDGMVNQLVAAGWQAVPPWALVFSLVSVAIYVTVVLAASRGLWRVLRQDAVTGLAIALFVAYMVLLPGPIAYVRFRVPVMPLIYVLASCALWRGP